VIDRSRRTYIGATGRSRFGSPGLLAREDLLDRAAEAGDDVLAGEFIIIEQQADRAVGAINRRCWK
jgi:hypothetical protein